MYGRYVVPNNTIPNFHVLDILDISEPLRAAAAPMVGHRTIVWLHVMDCASMLNLHLGGRAAQGLLSTWTVLVEVCGQVALTDQGKEPTAEACPCLTLCSCAGDCFLNTAPTKALVPAGSWYSAA